MESIFDPLNLNLPLDLLTILAVLGFHYSEWAFSSCGLWALFPWGVWDLSSSTRDRTLIPGIGSWILNNWSIREVPWLARWVNSGNSVRLYFSGLQNHCRWWLQKWIKRLLGRKVITNVDSILKSRDITLPTKVRLVKAMVFPVVMYGCESWTIKKAEHQNIDSFELWCWRRLLRVPWTARRSKQSILKEISPGCSLEGLMLKLKL